MSEWWFTSSKWWWNARQWWVYHTLISPSLTSISPSLTSILPSLACSKPSFAHLAIIEKLHQLPSSSLCGWAGWRRSERSRTPWRDEHYPGNMRVRKAAGLTTSIREMTTFFVGDRRNRSVMPMKTPISLSRVLRVLGVSSPWRPCDWLAQHTPWYLCKGDRLITKLLDPLMQSVTLEILLIKLSMEVELGMRTFLPSESRSWNFLLLTTPVEKGVLSFFFLNNKRGYKLHLLPQLYGHIL